MSTPRQPPSRQQPSPDLDDPVLAVAIAAALVTATSAAAAVAALKLRFALSAAVWQALSAVLGQVMSHPPPVTGIVGPASQQTARMNAARRAQYVTAASKRVLAAQAAARAKGEPVQAATQAALATEQRYYAQHQQAMWQRATAAGKTDMAAAEHGRLLGWYSIRDKRTSPECRAADGKNFYVTAMPDIGFPGAVHGACRCFPGPAHRGGRLLPSHLGGYARAA